MKSHIRIVCTIFFISFSFLSAQLPISEVSSHIEILRREILDQIAHNNGNINSRDNEGKTPLFKVVQELSSPECLPHLRELLQHGADPNMQDNNGQTPLHIALEKSDIGTFNFLLENRANPNTLDADGKTILHEALDYLESDDCSPETIHCCAEFIFSLIKHGADITLVTSTQEAPLHRLARLLLPMLSRALAGNLLRRILVAGFLNRPFDLEYIKTDEAVMEVRSGQERLREKPQVKRMLEVKGIPKELGDIILLYGLPRSIDTQNALGLTAYQIAAYKNNIITLRLLALLGADIQSPYELPSNLFSLIGRNTLKPLKELQQHSTSIVPRVRMSQVNLPLLEEE